MDDPDDLTDKVARALQFVDELPLDMKVKDLPDDKTHYANMARAAIAIIVEECAKVADSWLHNAEEGTPLKELVAAIRSLSPKVR